MIYARHSISGVRANYNPILKNANLLDIIHDSDKVLSSVLRSKFAIFLSVQKLV